MTADVARDLAAARGMTDMNCALEVELLHELCEIVCVCIEVISVPRLIRTTVATPIVRDHAIAS